MNFNNLVENNIDVLNEILQIDKIRNRALKELAVRGIPNNRMEQWKNFYFKDIENSEYKLNIDDHEHSFNLKFFNEFTLENAFESIVFENDKCTYQGQIDKFQNGVIFGTLFGAISEFPDLVEKYLDKLNNNSHGFLSLNSAVATDGYFLYVPAGISDKIIFNVYEAYNSSEKYLTAKKNLVVIESGSNVELNIFSKSEKNDNHLALSTTEVSLAKRSSLEMNNIQDHNGNTQYLNFHFFNQQQDSELKSNYFTLNSNNTRNEVKDILKETGCKTELNGSYLMRDEQKIDNNINIDHASPECFSNQLFKGILYDNSQGAFTGKILVRKDSQKTEAYQSTKNILLSDFAKMNMNPFLEIYADDVKCSHGASLGDIDEDALFYLQSRGINKEEAKKILLKSFLNDIVMKVSDQELHNMINDHMFAKL